MIIRHEIRKQSTNEEILILYFDYKEEFSHEWFEAISDHSVVQKIAKYIKQHRIKWKGNKVIIISGGIVLATLLTLFPVENLKVSNGLTYGFQYVDQGVISKTTSLPQLISQEIQENHISNEESFSTENETPSDSSTVLSNSSDFVSSNPSNSYDTSTDVPDQDISGPTVTIYRSNGNIITLGLEEYLVGVVGSEMPASFNLEALKAQAVVARTYTLRSIQLGKKLTDTQDTQTYKNQDQLRQEWGSSFDMYYQKVKTAVDQVQGKYLTYNGNYIEALYFSTSNGYTEDAYYVWGNSVPYLKSVASSWDLESRFFWNTVYKDKSQVFSLFGADVNVDSTISILERNASGRVISLKLGSQIVSGVTFRNQLGLASCDFEIVEENGQLKITTKGWGHGVGMSQYGANGMAKEGYSYDEILKYYYQGVELQG